MAAIEYQKQFCGEVFVTTNYVVLLECKYCFEQFAVYEEFLNHIFDIHFDNIDECKNYSEDDMDILNAFESDVAEIVPTTDCSANQRDSDIYPGNDCSSHGTPQRLHGDLLRLEEQHVAERCYSDDNTQAEESNEQSADINTSNTIENANGKQLIADDKQQYTNHKNNDTYLEIEDNIKTGVERKLKCKFCCAYFTNTGNLNRHEQRHSSTKPFPCVQCSKSFFTRTELKVHMRWHTGERPCICTYCGKGFVSQNTLNRHVKSHLNRQEQRNSSVKRFPCEQCSKLFFTRIELKVHIRWHTGERPCICTQCGKGFVSQNILNRHVRRHLNNPEQQQDSNLQTAELSIRPVMKKHIAKRGIERKFKCGFCDLDFFSKTNLDRHEKRHSNNKPYACETCSKTFFSRNELTTHTRWHTGERPFICPYCGRGFITPGALNTHEKRHLNKRTFKCDQCDKSFFSGTILRQHMSTHTGERNFKCEECNKTFTRRKSLRNHMKLHENALRYECNICRMRFNQKPTLLWHQRRKHELILGADAEKASNVIEINQTNGKTMSDTPSVKDEEFQHINEIENAESYVDAETELMAEFSVIN